MSRVDAAACTCLSTLHGGIPLIHPGSHHRDGVAGARPEAIDLLRHAQQILEDDFHRYPGLRDLHWFHRERWKDDILQLITAQADRFALSRLEETDRERYAELVSAEGRESAMAWSRGRIPDFDRSLRRELEDFRSEYRNGGGSR